MLQEVPPRGRLHTYTHFCKHALTPLAQLDGVGVEVHGVATQAVETLIKDREGGGYSGAGRYKCG